MPIRARDGMHTLDRQAEQLARRRHRRACRRPISPGRPPISPAWTCRRGILLLVPGGAPHRPAKRWPVQHYAALARLAAAAGVTPVIVGSAAEAALGADHHARRRRTRAISPAGPASAMSSALGTRALHAVGNDTGPMHLLVACGAAATVLYSAASDPALTAPRGPHVTILRRDDLAALTVEEVAATLPFG